MAIVKVIPRLEAVMYDGLNGEELDGFWANSQLLQEDSNGAWIKTGPSLFGAVVIIPLGGYITRKSVNDEGTGHFIPGGSFQDAYVEIKDDALVNP